MMLKPGALLIMDGEKRRVVLRLVEGFRCGPPQLLGAHARRKTGGEVLAVDFGSVRRALKFAMKKLG